MEQSTATEYVDPLNYGYRRRGVNLPTEQAINDYPVGEYQTRALMLARLVRTLDNYWYQFASETFLGIPKHDDLDRMYFEFLNCYRSFLWKFKANRRSEDQIEKYWHGVRVRLWDMNMHVWQMISQCNKCIASENFYDELTNLALAIGQITREMELFAKGAFNATEHVIYYEMRGRKAIEVRHAENRAIKRDVFSWLDKNMSKFKSLDAAATGLIDGKVAPIAWRTARSYVGEWKKVRSTGTL